MSKEQLPRGIAMSPHGYRVRMSINGQQFHVGYYQTLALAKLAQEEAWRQKILGTFIPATERHRRAREARAAAKVRKLTVEGWSEQWLENLRKEDPPKSQGTITSYESVIRAHIVPAIGNKPLVEVTEDDITDLINGSGSRGVAYNVASVTRNLFNAAVRDQAGGLQVSPMSARVVKPRPGARGDADVPTLEEVRLLAAAMPPSEALAVELAAWCQPRLGEVLGLQRRDLLDLDSNPRLRIDRQFSSKSKPPAYAPPKDDSHRTVSIPASLVPKIKKHLKAHVGPNPVSPLFPSSTDKTRPMSHTAFRNRWDKAREKVRPELDFHALRHFGLTMFAQTGATTEEILRRGGHRDADVGQRYQHASMERDRELTKKLNAAIKGDK